MPVITFPGLVVIPENTYFIYDIGQTVLEGMPGPCQRLRKSPKHEFRKLVLGIHNSLAK